MARRKTKRRGRKGRTSTGRIKKGYRLTKGGSVVKARRKTKRRRRR